jgi:hypothetical protein
MSIAIQESADVKFLEIDLSGKLAKEDYNIFLPEIERQIHEHGKLRLLVHMHDFHGWTAGAIWEDIKFDAKHFTDFERIAFVGDQKWESAMSKFCHVFTTAKIRFFDEAKLDEARAWLSAT